MIKFKKILAAAMTGAMLLGTVVTAAPVLAYAEGEDEEAKSAYTIDVDYRRFEATVKADKKQDAYIVLEVLKENSATSKVSNTYSYSVVELTDGKFGAVIDLSFLKIKKDAYIRVRGNSESVASDIKTVSAQQAKFSMKYTSGQATLAAALLIDKAAAKAEDLEKYEYRTLYGSEFIPLTALDADLESTDDDVFKTLEVAGTTLVVRKTAVEDKAADEDTGAAAVAGAPASPEVKVKISAAPKAPKVTIDYAKGTIKLPKDVKLQLISTDDSGNATVTDWVKSSETVVDQADILGLFFKVGDEGIDDADALKDKIADLTASGFTVAVCTQKEGKAASNPTILTVKQVETLEQSKDEDDNLIDKVEVGTSSLTWKTTDKGIEYTVAGAPFEYKDGEKWKTLKVGTTTVKGVVSADKTVEVRAAGVKTTKDKEGTFPSSTISITVKKYTAPVASVTVTVDPTEVTNTAAASATCKAVVKDADDKEITDATIKWSISGPGATVTIDEDTGAITVPKNATKGDYTITATCGEKTGTAKLTVK